MRTVPALILDALETGQFVGEYRNSGRVTVEPDWWLTTEAETLGNWPTDKRPVRWWQRADNSQVEVEIPNVTLIDIDRGIDNAAGACTITLLNQHMRANVTAGPPPTELGEPGYFTFSRGDSPESAARWGHTKNDWNHVLVPDALLRTYEGYGGQSKPLASAIADGNVMLTGVWLVDDVNIGTSGQVQVRCRDMMKLLIEQQLYPPLVPLSRYPLDYRRWIYTGVPLNQHGSTINVPIDQPPGDQYATFADSSVDHWYPQGSPGTEIPNGGYTIHGHHGADAFDGNTDTYWLGEGNSRPDAEFAVNFLEVDAGGAGVNAVFVHPWGGGYMMYVSVMENGIWQGDPNNPIPYDPSILFGTQPYAVDTGAGIPFVASFGVQWEIPEEFTLPRVYAAQRVRISFRDLTDSGIGPWRYRAGVREFKVRIGSGTSGGTQVVQIPPLWLAADTHPVSGYLTSDQRGVIDVFGDFRAQTKTGGNDFGTRDLTTAVLSTKSGNGYWRLDAKGAVTCYGDAVNHGDLIGLVNLDTAGPPQELAWDMGRTHTGNGYWIITTLGRIFEFGDAASYADVPPSGGVLSVGRIAGHPTLMGALVMDPAGVVTARGGATDLGDLPPTFPEGGTDIALTSTGNGYWILTPTGRVAAFGDAVHYGEIPNAPHTVDPSLGNWRNLYWQILPAADDGGYILMRGDGIMDPFGHVGFYGGPGGGQAFLRSDGDYKDYADIVKDLVLWSGFWLQEDVVTNEAPSVYGAIESTGAYADEALPADMFDKRPVIDAINELKEVVGYIVYVDDEGAFRFESPNWWGSGNFDEDGVHTDQIPEVDEAVDLTQYAIVATDRPVRSEIIISSDKVDPAGSAGIGANPVTASVKYTRYVPRTARMLRGMVRPAMWVNGFFTSKAEQSIMAELIALHIWFQIRTGNATAQCNPGIQVNDQVRILERQTSETYIHYVRGKHTVNDIVRGEYTMSLTTNWLGDHSTWAVTAGDVDLDDGLGRFRISTALAEWIRRGGADSRARHAASLYDSLGELTQKAVPDYTDDGDQAGPE